MGPAVAMALFLPAVAAVLAALTAVAWSLVQTFRLRLVGARAVLCRGRR